MPVVTDDPQPVPVDGPLADGSSLVSSTTMLLVAAGRAAQRRLEDALRPHGVTLRHLGALGHLAADAELSYSDLARRVSVTVQSMHSTIATLVDVGAIEVESAARGRPARLRLTERGHELLRTAGRIAHELDASLPLGGLDGRALKGTLLRIGFPGVR